MKIIDIAAITLVVAALGADGIAALAQPGGGNGGAANNAGVSSTGGDIRRLNELPDIAVEGIGRFLGQMYNQGLQNTRDYGTWEGGSGPRHDSFGGQNNAGPAGSPGSPRSGNA